MLVRFFWPSFLTRWPKVRGNLQWIPVYTASIIVVLFTSGVFYGAVIVSEPVTWNWWMIGELNFWKELRERRLWINWRGILVVICCGMIKVSKTSVRAPHVSNEIWTGHFGNTSYKFYRLSKSVWYITPNCVVACGLMFLQTDSMQFGTYLRACRIKLLLSPWRYNLAVFSETSVPIY
jgi:hypothetical protein